MQPRSLEQRVTVLEQQMQELRELPARVGALELQIVRLRVDMGAGFFATRSDLQGEMYDIRDELRTEIHAIRDELRAEMHAIRDELRGEIRSGNEETRQFMRMLHEDVVARIAAIGEGGRVH